LIINNNKIFCSKLKSKLKLKTKNFNDNFNNNYLQSSSDYYTNLIQNKDLANDTNANKKNFNENIQENITKLQEIEKKNREK